MPSGQCPPTQARGGGSREEYMFRLWRTGGSMFEPEITSISLEIRKKKRGDTKLVTFYISSVFVVFDSISFFFLEHTCVVIL